MIRILIFLFFSLVLTGEVLLGVSNPDFHPKGVNPNSTEFRARFAAQSQVRVKLWSERIQRLNARARKFKNKKRPHYKSLLSTIQELEIRLKDIRLDLSQFRTANPEGCERYRSRIESLFEEMKSIYETFLKEKG